MNPGGAAIGLAQEARLFTDYLAGVESARADLVETRRDIHRHPEPSGAEERTAGIVAERLRAAGFEVRTGVGGHGVVGLLRGGGPGPVLAFRADMDAVRDGASDPMPFASVVPGVNHTCGHDIHTAVGLALAEGFGSVRERLSGSVMLVFQPAEETATGARAMLRDAAISNPTPDAIFAVHTAPYEVGRLATARSTLMPGRDIAQIDIRGKGDLRSAAERVSHLLRSVATIAPGAATRPVRGDFVLTGGVGAAPDGAGGWTVRATLTTSGLQASREARAALARGLEEMEADEVEFRLNYRERWIDGVTNDPAIVEVANASVREALDAESVRTVEAMIPLFSEDFGAFQREVPGVMYFLGVSNAEEGWVGMPHTPGYVADEDAIFVAARAFGAVFLDLFEHGVPASR